MQNINQYMNKKVLFKENTSPSYKEGIVQQIDNTNNKIKINEQWYDIATLTIDTILNENILIKG